MESILAVAQAAIGDVSTDENRSKNFGLIGAAFGLGFILGPYIGGRLSAPGVSFYHLFTTPRWFGATTPIWFAAAQAATNATFVFFTLPGDAHHTSHRTVERGRFGEQRQSRLHLLQCLQPCPGSCLHPCRLHRRISHVHRSVHCGVDADRGSGSAVHCAVPSYVRRNVDPNGQRHTSLRGTASRQSLVPSAG